MGNTKSNTAITDDWVDVDIDDSLSEYTEDEEDVECDGKLLRACYFAFHWHLAFSRTTHVSPLIIFALEHALSDKHMHTCSLHFITHFLAVSFSDRGNDAPNPR
jgi:hypothetical protein